MLLMNLFRQILGKADFTIVKDRKIVIIEKMF
jgi:hypothetical protein